MNDGLSTTTTPAKIASVKVKVNGFELLFLGASWLTIRSFGSWPTVASTDIHSMSGFLWNAKKRKTPNKLNLYWRDTETRTGYEIIQISKCVKIHQSSCNSENACYSKSHVCSSLVFTYDIHDSPPQRYQL